MARGRPRDPKRDQAFELWKDSHKQMKLVDIAAQLGVSDSKVRKWKAEDKWEEQINGAHQNEKGSAPKKKTGAPKGNQNAKGNRGGKGGPSGNQKAKGNRGGQGGPIGNKKAVTTGEFETILWDTLEDDEKEIWGQIPTDPVVQINHTISTLTIRERRMMKRIQDLKNGLTEKQRRVLMERKTVKKPVEVTDPVTGDKKVVTVPKEEMVETEIEETDFRVIEDILSLEEALTRVQDKKIKAIETKHRLTDRHQLDVDKLDIDRRRLAIEKAKNEGDDNTEDDGFLEALSGKINEVWDEEA
ncbi:terminase [Heliobacillus mobilis]|uniref:Terminase n=1 Tax=Heliobacterium mobile TaxID=28064 RepID=A0A6I3SFD1_HELMO|nr:phage terminase small subunit [Heliobacterium mobile]MTV47750.1 terminase [Heliobacterium mobile]